MSLLQQGMYLIVILLSYMGFNYLTEGLLHHIIAVRMSRGKKILVHVLGLDGWYWTNGTLEDNYLQYETKEGDKKSLTIKDRDVINRAFLFNLPFINTDAVHNAVLKPDFKAVEGFDAKFVDNVVKQALNKPKKEIDERLIKITMVAAVFTLVCVGFLIYKFLPLQDLIMQMMSQLTQLRTVG